MRILHLADAYDARRPSLHQPKQTLTAVDGQVGVVVEISGRPVALDLVSRPEVFAALLPRPLTFGERLLGLLEDSARSSTYKPALLLALLDAAAQHADTPQVPVRSLAERVIELLFAADARLSDDRSGADPESGRRPADNRSRQSPRIARSSPRTR